VGGGGGGGTGGGGGGGGGEGAGDVRNSYFVTKSVNCFLLATG